MRDGLHTSPSVHRLMPTLNDDDGVGQTKEEKLNVGFRPGPKTRNYFITALILIKTEDGAALHKLPLFLLQPSTHAGQEAATTGFENKERVPCRLDVAMKGFGGRHGRIKDKETKSKNNKKRRREEKKERRDEEERSKQKKNNIMATY